MFEMLGNWSFGDYFKKEAISWAWELLVDVYGLPKERLYATIFEGSPEEGIERDDEAYGYWKRFLPEDHIILGNKHDNFWEMGDTGPCGPCSEIHYDLRSDEERRGLDGRELVNKGHHLVIEIWNLVFMQFNRKADGRLEPLPARHVDTGMGFERLCMVLQGKQSNYDTDVFQPTIGRLGEMCGRRYGDDPKTDVAMRVVADHLRAIAFSDRRRSASVECQGRVRDPSHLASRRPVRLYLPRFRRAVYLPAGRRAGRSDGRAVPRTGRPAGTDRKSDRGGGKRVPEDAFDGHQPARGRHEQGSLGRQRHDRRQRCVSAVRYLRFPDRSDRTDRLGRRHEGRYGRFRRRTATPERTLAQCGGRRYGRLGRTAADRREPVRRLRYVESDVRISRYIAA